MVSITRSKKLYGIFYTKWAWQIRTIDQAIMSRLDGFSPQHQPRPILQRLREVTRSDILAPRQIRDRARQLEYSVICPR